jgi:hypothetical protein
MLEGMQPTNHRTRRRLGANGPAGLKGLCLGALLLLAPAAGAVETRFQEPNTTRATRVTTPEGQPLGEGTLTQWMEGDKLHVQLVYTYLDGRAIEEIGVFAMQPEIAQERWAWRERMNGQVRRDYRIDFSTGKATGVSRADGKEKHFSDTLKVEPGKTFAGVGFAVAAKNLLPQLRQGEQVELQALAFTPQPRKVKVQLSQQGSARVSRDGQQVTADKVVIHPDIGIASLVVKAPDTVVYFAGSEPPSLIMGEGTLLEPGDPKVRTEVLAPKRPAAAARRGPAQQPAPKAAPPAPPAQKP